MGYISASEYVYDRRCGVFEFPHLIGRNTIAALKSRGFESYIHSVSNRVKGIPRKQSLAAQFVQFVQFARVVQLRQFVQFAQFVPFVRLSLISQIYPVFRE
jgi:hypothetical protein